MSGNCAVWTTRSLVSLHCSFVHGRFFFVIRRYSSSSRKQNIHTTSYSIVRSFVERCFADTVHTIDFGTKVQKNLNGSFVSIFSLSMSVDNAKSRNYKPCEEELHPNYLVHLQKASLHVGKGSRTLRTHFPHQILPLQIHLDHFVLPSEVEFVHLNFWD